MYVVDLWVPTTTPEIRGSREPDLRLSVVHDHPYPDAIGVPAGVAAGRQRGTEIGVAFTQWLGQTANFMTRYTMAMVIVNAQISMGTVGTELDPQIKLIVAWMMNTWQTDNARLTVGNFTAYELDLITAFRKTGALGGFVAGQAIGPAIGETSGAIYGVMGSALTTAAVNGLRTYMEASANASAPSPVPAAVRRLLQSLLPLLGDDSSSKPDGGAIEALIQSLLSGRNPSSQGQEQEPTEQQRRRKTQSLAASAGLSPVATAAAGAFAGDFTNAAPLMGNAIAGWAATSIAIGASAGIGAGVANSVAWGIGRSMG